MNNTIKVAFWVVIALLFVGTYRLGIYQLDIYYSNLSPTQLTTEVAYSATKVHPMLEAILTVLLFVGIIWVIIRIFKVLDK